MNKYKRNINEPLSKSFKYAFTGLVNAFIKERNMRIHFLIMILVISFGFILNISNYEWYVCLILFGLVISSELINTAIENTVDMVTQQYNEKVKYIKDISAGAVLINAIIAAIIGLIIFIPKF
jgi:diacylglycerol kinase